MCNNNNVHGAATVATFPFVIYVFLISLYALVVVLFADLLDMLACLHMVNFTSPH
jgi:hypothetical protein